MKILPMFVVLSIFFVGCSTTPQPEIKTVQLPPPTPPLTYLTKCPEALPTLPEVESVSQELAWSTVLGGWAPDYFECSIRHNALVDWHKNQVAPEIEPEPEPEKKKRFGIF